MESMKGNRNNFQFAATYCRLTLSGKNTSLSHKYLKISNFKTVFVVGFVFVLVFFVDQVFPIVLPALGPPYYVLGC